MDNLSDSNFDRISNDFSYATNTRESLRKAINDEGVKQILSHLSVLCREASENNRDLTWSFDAIYIDSILPFIKN